MKTENYKIESFSIAVMGNFFQMKNYINQYRQAHYKQETFAIGSKSSSKQQLEDETSENSDSNQKPKLPAKSLWSKLNIFNFFGIFGSSKKEKIEKKLSILERHDRLITQLYRIGPSTQLDESEETRGGRLYIWRIFYVFTVFCFWSGFLIIFVLIKCGDIFYVLKYCEVCRAICFFFDFCLFVCFCVEKNFFV